MPLLSWNIYDFIAVLAVEPEDYEQVRYTFRVKNDDAWLTLIVWPLESVVGFSLGTTSQPVPLVEFAAFVRGSAVRREDDKAEWLELRDSIIVPNRFAYIEQGNLFDRHRFPYGYPMRVWISPSIRVEYARDHAIG